jgi:hypothetical protein
MRPTCNSARNHSARRIGLFYLRGAVTAAVNLLIIVGVVPKQAPRWILYLRVAIFDGTIVPTYSVVMADVNDLSVAAS